MAKRELAEYAREVEQILGSLTRQQMEISFDTLSDTLYLNFNPSATKASNVYVGGGWMVRVDRHTVEVVGIQIENVLSHESDQFPFLLNLILLTDPEGYLPSPVETAARRLAVSHSADTMAELREKVPDFVTVGD